MDSTTIVTSMNGFLHAVTKSLAEWIRLRMPTDHDSWWDEYVLDKLSHYQCERIEKDGLNNLEQLDLAALLRIADKNWFILTRNEPGSREKREKLKSLFPVRNNWAHSPAVLPEAELILADLRSLGGFLFSFEDDLKACQEVEAFTKKIQNSKSVVAPKAEEPSKLTTLPDLRETAMPLAVGNQATISNGSLVVLKADRTKKGMVSSVSNVGDTRKFVVFVDGGLKEFFEDQIELDTGVIEIERVSLQDVWSRLSAYQINNPSSSTLYSLNAARIDFVPYQFRPALKLMKTDSPRLLIADSVGVGKTIEAGLIIKEIKARQDVDNILIVCPKPLVAERKWELEMKRFDETFISVDGPKLSQIIADFNRDGEWPERFSHSIIPYSLFDWKLLTGADKSSGKRARARNKNGLIALDPPPHFDILIVDEAHHVRNNTTAAYATVKFLCDNSDTVIFLTATPLQIGDEDIFTLLNLLRPDVVIDPQAFNLMSQPNPYINQAVRSMRANTDDWQKTASAALEHAASTQWGSAIIKTNPEYQEILDTIALDTITREQRVSLISKAETLHSFSEMINRTRRQDIEDFCVRRSYTIETEFTPEQRALHDELLEFEAAALTILHGGVGVAFMMSTIKRQAASCIFGLAPFIESIIKRRLSQVLDNPEYDFDIDEPGDDFIDAIREKANQIIRAAKNLPSEDPKIKELLGIIKEKQAFDNNKVMVFSTFRHTLSYIQSKLGGLGYRMGRIDGSVGDDDRYQLRNRFSLPKSDSDALDIVLFTEVGSEGLDYQFCDAMVNYDLPWNPMRIEQRIGRIDRRGQQSEAVSIYNMITSDTVDAVVYERCLKRIGIFEASIGDCSEILGELNAQIQDIAYDPNLTDEERARKLEQISDNKVREIDEMKQLEEEEKQLFGFDLSNYLVVEEVQNAESSWISAQAIQAMVEQYLAETLGGGPYISGEQALKSLRLSNEARIRLRKDFDALGLKKSQTAKSWEKYLKGSEQYCKITFENEAADFNREALFITASHPLAKQAATHFDTDSHFSFVIRSDSTDIKAGTYPFAIYAWQYLGYKPQRKLVAISNDDTLQNELFTILQGAEMSYSSPLNEAVDDSQLELKHMHEWEVAQAVHKENAKAASRYKMESLTNSFEVRKRTLEEQIRLGQEERQLRMKEAELKNLETKHASKLRELEESAELADIHFRLFASGTLQIDA
jgi:superfamily II DNA/RNA helicase